MSASAVLVLAPHPDDEVFGCGGAIALHTRAGVPVDVLILTDGAVFGSSSVRAQESVAAAQVLGCKAPLFWALPDRQLHYSAELVQRLVQLIDSAQVDLLYAPSPWEVHPDHRHTSWLALQAVRLARPQVQLAFYEVAAPLSPNVLLDISSVAASKDAAMACFASQLAMQDYAGHIRALNRYRTYTLTPEVVAAEAYVLLNQADLDQYLAQGIVRPVALGSPLPSDLEQKTAPPLVSILIRSTDRDTLFEALDSVALQSYPAIEVVVVAARPGHQALPPRCGPYALRLVSTNTALARSAAANRALAHAQGDLLLFLDDDDWLMPAHIARLVNVLQAHRYAQAAYTGIGLVDAQGQSMGQCFDLPFDPIRQLAGNLTPIHAVLFRRSVLDLGCRFDEQLDCYEDWDFWLQLSKSAPMVHLPGLSAMYRIHASSGVHEDAGPLGTAAAVVYRKWAANWSTEQFGQMMQRVWSHPELALRLSEAQAAQEDCRRGWTQAEQRLLETQNSWELSREVLAQTERNLAQQHLALEEAQRALKASAEQSGQQQQALLQQADALRQQHLTHAQQAQRLQEQALALAQESELGQQHVLTINALRIRVQQLEQDGWALTHSRSWRITQPMRWLGTWARRIFK